MEETSKKQFVSYKEYLPQLSLKERDRRWAAVWEEMVINTLDCLLLF
jgi:hypothetical protein